MAIWIPWERGRRAQSVLLEFHLLILSSCKMHCGALLCSIRKAVNALINWSFRQEIPLMVVVLATGDMNIMHVQSITW